MRLIGNALASQRGTGEAWLSQLAYLEASCEAEAEPAARVRAQLGTASLALTPEPQNLGLTQRPLFPPDRAFVSQTRA